MCGQDLRGLFYYIELVDSIRRDSTYIEW